MKKTALPTKSPAAKLKSASARVRKVDLPEAGPVEPVDTSYLRTLVGYNARRASLAIIESFMVRMAPYDLKVVDFSVLSLVAHNPGITSRQLCAALNVLPPNLVGLIAALERRGLIERLPHPSDGRAMGVHLTPQGTELMVRAEKTAFDLEMDATSRLTDAERKTLIRLLQKVYTPVD
ncbi:MarR Transcriptional regulators [Comamonadaceae bacterium]